jgi:hypothetical protein
MKSIPVSEEGNSSKRVSSLVEQAKVKNETLQRRIKCFMEGSTCGLQKYKKGNVYKIKRQNQWLCLFTKFSMN